MARIDAAAGRLTDLSQQFDVLGRRVVQSLNVFVIDERYAQVAVAAGADVELPLLSITWRSWLVP